MDFRIDLTKSEKKGSVTHYNYISKTGQVYCRKENEVIFASDAACSDCDKFGGFMNGRGYECVWKDPENSEDIEVFDPKAEYARLNK